MINFLNLPAYQAPNALNFGPMTQALQNNAQNALAQRRIEQDDRRIGFEQQRLGFEAANAARQAQLFPGQLEALRLSNIHSQGQESRAAAMHGPQMEAVQADIAAKNAALAQAKTQTPEWRQTNATRFGIDIRTPEGQAWVVNGTYSPKDPLTSAISNMLVPQISGQPQAPSATSPIHPQSFGGGADAGGIVRVDQPVQPTPAPQTYNTPLGSMTEEQARKLSLGLAMAGKGDAGKLMMDEVNRLQLGKEATNENQKSMLKDYETLQQIRNMRASMDPKFLEIPVKAGMAWNSLRDSFGALSEDKKKDLYRFATFRRDSAEMFNTAIKNNSGATVTEQEFRRNGVQYANAGSGVFDGDGPTEFKAKIDRGEEVIMLGLARKKYLQDQGFKGSLDAAANMVPVEQMRMIIKNRAAQIGQDIKARNPTADPAAILQETERQVRKDFGI